MAASADHEELVETLIAADVLTEREDDQLGLTEEFQETRSKYRGIVEEMDEEDYEAERDAYIEEVAVSADDVDRDDIADAMAVQRTCEDLDATESLIAALSLNRFDDPIPSFGVPENFVPIRGEEIEAFMEANPVSVIYFWREDCDPCDLVKEGLEQMCEDGTIPEEMGKAAVYGPECATLIREEYDVGMAPTILFVANSRIDSRLMGMITPDGIENEVEIIGEHLDDEGEDADEGEE